MSLSLMKQALFELANDSITSEKICSVCKRSLPATDIYFHPRSGKYHYLLGSECRFCKKGGKKLVTHHRDQNPNNNSGENIQFLENRSKHGKLHAAQGFLYAQLMYNPLVEWRVL